MTLNYSKVGEPIALIKNTDENIGDKIVYLNSNPKIKSDTDFSKLELKDNEYFQQYPNEKMRIGYITGSSGSGKSTYILKFAKEYYKYHKKNNIFLFSSLKEDETLDEFKKITRVPLDDRLLDEPLSIEDFHECLALFDDIDNIHNDDIKNEIYKVVHSIAETGRHTKTMCIMSNHLPTNRQRTAQILNECSYVVYFPRFAKEKINYLLQTYIGVDKKFHSKMKKKSSRWCCIFNVSPMVIMLENEIFIYEY